MSNTYYKYKKTQKDTGYNPEQKRTVNTEITLTAYSGGSHNIQLTIMNVGDYSGVAYITLTEKEQDELIAGILERRKSISATGSEQSKIHPAEKD